jgi:hypothetical protein
MHVAGHATAPEWLRGWKGNKANFFCCCDSEMYVHYNYEYGGKGGMLD